MIRARCRSAALPLAPRVQIAALPLAPRVHDIFHAAPPLHPMKNGPQRVSTLRAVAIERIALPWRAVCYTGEPPPTKLREFELRLLVMTPTPGDDACT